MKRRALYLAVLAVAGCLWAAVPASAQPSLTMQTTVTNASSGPCTNGTSTWTVAENITITNDSTSVDTVQDITYTGKYSPPAGSTISSVTVLDPGGLVAGTSIQPGATQTFHVLLQFSLPCGATDASVGPLIDLVNGHMPFHSQAAFLTTGTGVPATTYAGIGLAVVALGGLFVVVQLRRKRTTEPSDSLTV